ncbi:MAG TPA: class I SAM-dependent methyltransferase [Solirubrobacteraceae bacterium]
MSDSADLVAFYDDAYSTGRSEAELYSRWRALGAVGKADHVIALCRRVGIAPSSTLEIGCGDGALLSELHRRGFGGRLSGLEITDAAVRLARERPEIDAVDRYDGLHIAAPDGAHDLGLLSHVLEHVADPAALVREAARTSRAVLFEVPLEANWSARRPRKREHATEVGHLQRLDLAAARAMIAGAGLSRAGELEDPLPLAVHRFFAATATGQAAASARWAVRASLHRASPGLARRLFTVHYACLCLPPAGWHPRTAAPERDP